MEQGLELGPVYVGEIAIPYSKAPGAAPSTRGIQDRSPIPASGFRRLDLRLARRLGELVRQRYE